MGYRKRCLYTTSLQLSLRTVVPLHPPYFVVQYTDIAVTIFCFPFRHKLSYRIACTTSFRFVFVIWVLSTCDLFQTMSEKSSMESIEPFYGYPRMSISSRVFHQIEIKIEIMTCHTRIVQRGIVMAQLKQLRRRR